MANNKVQLADGTVLLDVTPTTATASDVNAGKWFLTKDGILTEGTAASYAISQSLTNVTSSNDDTKVLSGGSFYAALTPTNGYAITSITVTMGGVDVTDQYFTPGVGAKAITANGTYNASSDNLSGYDQVVVNVPSAAADLGTKEITANGTYNASADSLDGYSSVTVNVPTGGGSPTLQSKSVTYTPSTSTQTDTVSADSGYDGLSSVDVTVNPIPSSYIIPSGSQTITSNGTYDVSALAEAVVNVSGGGSSIQYATGTYTPSQTYNTTGNRAIVTVSEIGFTPTRFILRVTDKTGISGTQYAVLYALFDNVWPLRVSVRYSNTSNSSSASVVQSAWTTQSNYYLYFNGSTIYFRTTGQFILVGDVEYTWEAYA